VEVEIQVFNLAKKVNSHRDWALQGEYQLKTAMDEIGSWFGLNRISKGVVDATGLEPVTLAL